MSKPYKKSAQLYDLFCQAKNYQQASQELQRTILDLAPDAQTLLDVACGTGGHLEYLCKTFSADGMDLSRDMLEVARQKCPHQDLHHGDFTQFNLGKKYDAVICMFGSIGYSGTLAKLQDAIKCMTNHLRPGGVLILEPWLTPESYIPGKITADLIDQPGLKACRMYINQLVDKHSWLDIEYLIADNSGVHRFSEQHLLGLFTNQEYMDALNDGGLEVSDNTSNLFGYGLFTGVLYKQ